MTSGGLSLKHHAEPVEDALLFFLVCDVMLHLLKRWLCEFLTLLSSFRSLPIKAVGSFSAHSDFLDRYRKKKLCTDGLM